jgi:hypothetical protein
MYALFTLEQDFILSNLNFSFNEAGLKFQGIFRENFEDDLDFYLVYKIISEKRFNFSCITMGILPKVSETNPIKV